MQENKQKGAEHVQHLNATYILQKLYFKHVWVKQWFSISMYDT